MAANCKQDNKYPPHPCPCPEIPGPPGSQGPVGPPSDCCFDSGWIISGDHEIRTIISCDPGPCIRTCVPAPIS